MIKAKQSERESKRLEGDVKKEQRHLHHTLKELDIGQYGIIYQRFISIDFSFIYLDAIKKRLDTEKSLSKNLEDKDKIEREFFKKREQVYIMISFFANIFIQYTKARSFIRLPDISQVNRNYIDLLDISLPLLYLNFNIL
jgi:isoleucyl-tRNA synthetase